MDITRCFTFCISCIIMVHGIPDSEENINLFPYSPYSTDYKPRPPPPEVYNLAWKYGRKCGGSSDLQDFHHIVDSYSPNYRPIIGAVNGVLETVYQQSKDELHRAAQRAELIRQARHLLNIKIPVEV